MALDIYSTAGQFYFNGLKGIAKEEFKLRRIAVNELVLTCVMGKVKPSEYRRFEALSLRGFTIDRSNSFSAKATRNFSSYNEFIDFIKKYNKDDNFIEEFAEYIFREVCTINNLPIISKIFDAIQPKIVNFLESGKFKDMVKIEKTIKALITLFKD